MVPAETKPNPPVAPDPTPPKTSSSAMAPAATKPNPPVAPDPTPRVAKPTKPADPPNIPSPEMALAAKPRTIPDDTTHHQGSSYLLSNFGLTDQKEEDAIGKQDEQPGPIILRGKIKGKIVSILIDTGSTYSFINSEKAKVLDLIMEETKPLPVVVADGRNIFSSAICRRVQCELEHNTFEYDLRVMDIEEDIILGVDWMRSFKLISFDYEQSEILLSYVNGRTIVLTAYTGNANAFKDKQAASRAHSKAGTQISVAGNMMPSDFLFFSTHVLKDVFVYIKHKRRRVIDLLDDFVELKGEVGDLLACWEALNDEIEGHSFLIEKSQQHTTLGNKVLSTKYKFDKINQLYLKLCKDLESRVRSASGLNAGIEDQTMANAATNENQRSQEVENKKKSNKNVAGNENQADIGEQKIWTSNNFFKLARLDKEVVKLTLKVSAVKKELVLGDLTNRPRQAKDVTSKAS